MARYFSGGCLEPHQCLYRASQRFGKGNIPAAGAIAGQRGTRRHATPIAECHGDLGFHGEVRKIMAQEFTGHHCRRFGRSVPACDGDAMLRVGQFADGNIHDSLFYCSQCVRRE